MELYLYDRRFAYEAENICRLFFRDVAVRTGRIRQTGRERNWIYLRASTRTGGRIVAGGCLRSQRFLDLDRSPEEARGADIEQTLCRLLYDALCRLTNQRPPWGTLTGIRPAALSRKLLDSGLSRDEVRTTLCGKYRVDARKADLALEVAERARPVIERSGENSFSLYLSIPFCPSRCSYCSFVSKTVEREGALIEPYIERLCGDLTLAAGQADRLGLRLQSVYIGGGTPGILSAEQTQRLLKCLNSVFVAIPECTFEA